MELLVPRTNAPLDTASLIATLYRNHQAGRTIAPSQGESYAFFYSADYHFLAGKHFRNGQLEGKARLKFLASGVARSARKAASSSPYSRASRPAPNLSARGGGGACTDWYNAETGAYITTTGNCEPVFDNPEPEIPDPTYDGPNPGDYGAPDYPDYGGTPTGDGGSTIPLNPINSTLPPCADNILSNVRVTAENAGIDVGLMKDILAAVGAADAKIIIKYEPTSLLASSVAGDCRLVSKDNGYNSYSIRINQSFISGPSTDLLLAQILIHETLHASLMDWGQRNGLSNADMGFDNVLAYWMGSQGLDPSDAQGQHDAMSALVNQMGRLLYSYYLSVDHSASVGASQNQITSLNDCINLCWTGLENTIGYAIENNRNPNFKNRCDVIRDAELRNTYSAAMNADSTYTERFPAGQDPCK